MSSSVFFVNVLNVLQIAEQLGLRVSLPERFLDSLFDQLVSGIGILKNRQLRGLEIWLPAVSYRTAIPVHALPYFFRLCSLERRVIECRPPSVIKKCQLAYDLIGD